MGEETVSTTNAIESTGSAGADDTAVSTGGGSPDVSHGTPSSDTYSPNYGYKVYDEERQFDEWARPIITNKEMEDRLRSLFSKAGATDIMTSKREKQLKEFNELREKYDGITTALESISGHVNRDDLESFFKACGIPEEKVLKYAANKATYKDLTPEQKAAYDDYIGTRRSNAELERRLAHLEGHWQNDQVQTRTRDLDVMLTKPDVRGIATAFDQRLQQQGAFRNEVVRHALAEWNISGRDLPAEEAVSEVIRKIGHAYAQAGQVQTGASGGQPPVIPNVGSRNVSPTAKKPRSFDDLRKLAASME